MKASVVVALGSLVSALASSGQAHVDLISPTPRLGGQAGGGQLKTKPCGQSTNMRTDKVTTFAPGQQVEIKMKEYVDHPGYFAVAFDADGDDSFIFPRANPDAVVADADDPKALFPVDGMKVLGIRTDKDKNCASEPDKTCSITITIPNVNCQNCTLQVTQFMYDKLGDKSDNEYYYQCADIKIEGPLGSGGSGGTGGGGAGGSGGVSGGTGGTGGVATGGTGGAPAGGTAAGGGASGGTGGATSSAGTATTSGGSLAAGGVGGTTATAPAADDGGCSIGRPSRGAFSLLAAVGVGLALLRRRKSSR